jgi:hypothetical protein
LNANEIAQVCHEANRGFQLVQNSPTNPVSPPWTELDEETRRSAVDGVFKVLDNPDITAEDMWESWCEFKENAGWKLGEVKDVEKKTHPNLVDDYMDLPEMERKKDELFVAIVKTLKS